MDVIVNYFLGLYFCGLPRRYFYFQGTNVKCGVWLKQSLQHCCRNCFAINYKTGFINYKILWAV